MSRAVALHARCAWPRIFRAEASLRSFRHGKQAGQTDRRAPIAKPYLALIVSGRPLTSGGRFCEPPDVIDRPTYDEKSSAGA
jgi:hypothetical protein